METCKNSEDQPQIQFRPEAKKALIVAGKVYCSANVFELNEEDKKRARFELGETEEKKKKCVQELRERIAKDGVNCRTDESYLLRYLRVRKFNCDIAYDNIRQSAAFKKKYPQYFSLESNLASLLNLNIGLYLPHTDEEGNILIWVDIEKWDPRAQSVTEMFQMATAICDLIIENPKGQVNGTVTVYDCNAVNRHHISTLISNFVIPKYSFMAQNFYPWRITKVLVINTGFLTRLLCKLFRPLLSKKITDRIILLGSDLSELHQHVNPVLLPKKLGGTLDEEQYCVTQNVLDNIPFLKYVRCLN